ncbi:hypothetical protein NLG97_g8242 [Lecanicillium saksenae]|uniref:Uncharacterized protein n=1 Tax=Lecanicillium saksenae TaxID=468837 RepID=A0ACC1QL36_9HYPO|nr:hypothetical protein NLG97_g8242 [Lecanicillium saksenae]
MGGAQLGGYVPGGPVAAAAPKQPAATPTIVAGHRRSKQLVGRGKNLSSDENFVVLVPMLLRRMVVMDDEMHLGLGIQGPDESFQARRFQDGSMSHVCLGVGQLFCHKLRLGFSTSAAPACFTSSKPLQTSYYPPTRNLVATNAAVTAAYASG